VLGDEHTVIESVELETDGRSGQVLVAQVRPKVSAARRCSRCQRRCPGYDTSPTPRRWRALDLGTTQVFLQATTRRVSCREHGVVVAAVPWARPGSRFTTAFEDTAAWLVCHAALSVVAVLLRVAWRSVADIVTRVVADRAGRLDRPAGLRRIGIDEISYRKGRRYLLCVVDHDTGRLVWAGKNRTQETLGRFFDDLGADRAVQLTHVSADGAQWIHDVVAERAPNAVVCLDAFHVVAWATEALDQVRRAMVNRLRAQGHHDQAAALKHTRWALLKNPPNLTGNQRTTLAGIAKANGGLYRAYLLKEQLRAIFRAADLADARALLGGWIAWARRCRLEPFVRLAKTIKKYQALILNAVEHGLSNARSEATKHPPTTAHPPRLRLPQPRSADRHGRPHPRRPLPATPRTIMKRNPPKRQ
jgi:transposase